MQETGETSGGNREGAPEDAPERAAWNVLEDYAHAITEAWAQASGARRVATLEARNRWVRWMRREGSACVRHATRPTTPVWALEEDDASVRALHRLTVIEAVRRLAQAAQDEDEPWVWMRGTITERWLEAMDSAAEKADQALCERVLAPIGMAGACERARAGAITQAAGEDEGRAWSLENGAVEALAQLDRRTAERVSALGGWRTRVVCESAEWLDLAGDLRNAVHGAVATQGEGRACAPETPVASALEASLEQWPWAGMKPPVRVIWALACEGEALGGEAAWGSALALAHSAPQASRTTLAREWPQAKRDVREAIDAAARASARRRLEALLRLAGEARSREALECLEQRWKGERSGTSEPARLDADPVVAKAMVWRVPTDTAARVLGLSPEGERSRSARLLRAIRRHAGRTIEAACPEALADVGPIVRTQAQEAAGEADAQRWREAMGAVKKEFAKEAPR